MSKCDIKRCSFAAAFLLWFVFNFICIINHVHFRDEGQGWMIAQNINLTNYKHILAGEGHGLLWYLFIKPFILLGLPYRYFSFISLFVMSLSAFILLFKTKINDVIKILLIFSPVFSFYNAVIARSYCLCILELCILLYFYSKKNITPIFIGVLAFIMFQTHLYMAPMASMLILWLLYKAYTSKENKNPYLISAMTATLGAAFLYFTLSGASGSLNSSDVHRIKLNLRPLLLLDFHIIQGEVDRIFQNAYLFFISVVALNFIVNAKECFKRFIFALGSIGGILFIIGVYSVFHPQHKILMLAVILFCGYLICDKTQKKFEDKKFFNICNFLAFVLILSVSLLYPIHSFINEKYHYKYSNAKETADFILNNLKNERIIITKNTDRFPNLAAYLGKDNNLISGCTKSQYTFYDRKTPCSVPYDVYSKNNDDIYYIFTHRQFDLPDLTPVFEADYPTRWKENFYIYKKKEAKP